MTAQLAIAWVKDTVFFVHGLRSSALAVGDFATGGFHRVAFRATGPLQRPASPLLHRAVDSNELLRQLHLITWTGAGTRLRLLTTVEERAVLFAFKSVSHSAPLWCMKA